jgi:hypothetical protein
MSADPFADIPIKSDVKLDNKLDTKSSTSDPFADIPVEPTVSQKAGSFARGLGKGIVGGFGDIQEMGSDVSNYLAKKTMPTGMYETYKKIPNVTELMYGRLPRSEDVERGLQTVEKTVGIKPGIAPGTKGYEFAGEIAPAVAGGLKGLYTLGKYGFGKLSTSGGKELAESLKSKTTEQLKAEAERTGKTVKQLEVETKLAQEQSDIATRTAERLASAQSRFGRDLPGTVTIQEAGVFRPVAQTTSDIGQRIKDSANKVFETLKVRRAENAEKLKGDAFNVALNKEKQGFKVSDTKSFQAAIKEIDNALVNPDTKLTNVSVNSIKQQLDEVKKALDPRYVDKESGITIGKKISFEALENLRRSLRDRSYGFPEVGFDAISQQQANKLANSVENIMKEFSPGIENFLLRYAKDSQPLRVFQTKAGKALVDEQLIGKGVNYAKVPSDAIANNVFKNKENFGALIDSLGGNRTQAVAEARKFFASKLEGLGDSTKVENFIRQNRAMLKETEALADVERYAINLRNTEKRAEEAAKIAKERGGVATEKGKTLAEQQKLLSDYERLGTDLNRAKTIDEINLQATKLADTLEKSGAINIQQRDKLLNDIKQITDLQKKKEFTQKVIRWGLGATGAVGAGSAYTALKGQQ